MACGRLAGSSRSKGTMVTRLAASLGSRPKAIALRKKVSACCGSLAPALTCTCKQVRATQLQASSLCLRLSASESRERQGTKLMQTMSQTTCSGRLHPALELLCMHAEIAACYV